MVKKENDKLSIFESNYRGYRRRTETRADAEPPFRMTIRRSDRAEYEPGATEAMTYEEALDGAKARIDRILANR
jgi:hypothetical protein